jgi:hypothetical protein
MPDLPALFDKIRQVSPLARHVMTSGSNSGAILQSGLQGLAAAVAEDHPLMDDGKAALPWKLVERHPTHTVHQIDKLESFDGKEAPLFRFRATLQGPLVDGGVFGQYILDLDQRKKWDDKIDQVKQVHHLDALQDIFNLQWGSSRLSLAKSSSSSASSSAPSEQQQHNSGSSGPTNAASAAEVDLGECVRLGVGYGRTKRAMGITEREQLFWFGMQEFGGCGAYILWGQEVDDDNDDNKNNKNKQSAATAAAALWPEGSPKHTRAKSHLFSATLIPTSETTFDVEYVLQMEIGGQIPKFLTTPVLVETVKNLFKVASDELGSGIEALWKQKMQDQVLSGRELLLMTP